MGVYVKGLFMPKNCWDCPMVSGYELSDDSKVLYSTVHCRLLNKKRNIGEAIDPNCPLIEIPPHGRLVDADALIRQMNQKVEETNNVRYAWVDEMDISLADTIIEADDSIKQGEWEKHNDGIMYWWECSKCHHDAWYDEDELYNYCPWCGAKMTIIEAEGEDG